MAKPASITDLPPAFQEYLHGVYERANARIGEAMARHGMAPGLSAALAAERVAVLEAELAPVGELIASGGNSIACRKGCAYCCTHTVDVTPDEAFAIADHLAATLDPAALAQVKTRAAAADAALHGLPHVERHRQRIFCPVLDPETAACLAHPVRPNACQGYLSVDLAKCEADYRDPPQPVEQPTVAPMITSVVDRTRSFALEDAGAPTLSLELIAALLAAWREPDAEARWLAGEAIFADARSITP
ncbi:MAG TPA: YkgJ family cysteine cluster protein [Aliidongia sp.]|nr:YkgJ family cysteine cluster protein [Aliidongia sp.]